MYRKMVWCYIFVLTLLDISLNTKLTAQGKSHGITVHDSLIEGISFQEWGKDSVGESGGGGSGGAVPAGALRLSPAALSFGRAQLAAAHALTVTLTNTANTTMHLASVAGTTPDFHASFFDSKTLAPQANTTFTVVYLGRHEGLVSAHLYIHTSLGVHKYPVSAEGVASEWDVWPLIGIRVPLNATVDPLLTMYNPTDQTIQHQHQHQHQHHQHHQHLQHQPLTAYVRIKANMSGGGLVVAVEARRAAAGEHARPLQLRLRLRGAADPPHTWQLEAGNSAAASVPLAAHVWAARCGPAPLAPPPPPPPPLGAAAVNGATANGASGAGAAGVVASTLLHELPPHAPPMPAATLTLHFSQLWENYLSEMEAERRLEAESSARGAWCAGWVRLGRAAVPYSVRLLPGGVRALPAELHFITAKGEEVFKERELLFRNDFPVPIEIIDIEYGPDYDKYFHRAAWRGAAALAAGGARRLRVRLRAPAPATAARAHLTLRTNASAITVPLHVYAGTFHFEWEWPGRQDGQDGRLRVGALPAGAALRVRLRLRNPAPVALCAARAAAAVPRARAALQLRGRRCAAPGGSVAAALRLAAPARPGRLAGAVWVRSQHAAARAAVSLAARAGRLRAPPLLLPAAAPYTWSSAPLILESTMTITVRVLNVTQPVPDPAVIFVKEGSGTVWGGRHAVGTVHYAAERLCEPACYAGLALQSADGAAWLRRAAAAAAAGDAARAALAADAELAAARRALLARLAPAARNLTLHLHTDQVAQVAAAGRVRLQWPRLAAGGAAAGAAAVGGAEPLRVRVRNPASRALLLQPVLAAPLHRRLLHHTHHRWSEVETMCGSEGCVWEREAFELREWRAARGEVRLWAGEEGEGADAGQGQGPGQGQGAGAAPLLLLAAGAELELHMMFTPTRAAPLATLLYLRNNLTILESMLIWGRGVYPTFELDGRQPGSDDPILFEVSSCGAAGAAGGAVQRTVVARNTGAVAVRLRDWRLAGRPCAARGFRLQPCAPLTLAPNRSRALTLAFAPDYSLARVPAALTVRAGAARAAFALLGAAPARLLPACAARLPRPPAEPALRAAAATLALAALALVLAAAALDAERGLRRARAARQPAPPAAPLDLRALPAPPPPPPAAPRPPPARRRRAARRPPAPLDPLAERRAFERWRAEVLRRAAEDDDRSSEDADLDPETAADAAPPAEAAPPTPEPPPPEPDEFETLEEHAGDGPDEDGAFTGSDASTPSEERDEPDEERDEGDDEPPPIASTPPDEVRSGPREPETRTVPTDGDAATRTARGRRSSSPGRRADRPRGPDTEPARPRGAAARHHGRKEKATRRRGAERAPATPPRAPPTPGDVRAPAALRRGATWSSVVAEGAGGGSGATGVAPQLAPIGSDVRRRAEAGRPGANSLFYFNESPPPAAPEPQYAWRAPSSDCAPFSTPTHPYREMAEQPGAVGGYGSIGSVWGGALEPQAQPAAAWLWGAYGGRGAAPAAASAAAPDVRPPPGFGASPRPAPRTYDPFQSLAFIWGPGRVDWRPEPDDKDGQ
ncbi:uncharacterized protein LOC113521086 isoform X2 [Galleria mellonella]|uniref:Uncharacterized protein LOC113521086 isoform X2 n=1 Tax=Galleria mellonella TaxID=7137 RepID=A0ABM3MNN9_GALME|nr:uncharacterized protein LOC113521086 isoform X2 [Galleria mellonella]